jgi:glycosyltransferase involved in cell wall biosynthesis
MKILFATSNLPYPPNSGANIRTFNLIKLASKQHDISLISLVYEDEKIHISELEKYCKVYPIDVNIKKYGRLISLLSVYPYQTMIKYYSKTYKILIEQIVQENKYDIIQIESLLISANLKDINVPKVLDAHNIESDILFRTSKNNIFGLKSILNYLDYIKNLTFEKEIVQAMDACIAVSDNDLQKLIEMGTKKAIIVPNCTDLSYYQETKKINFKPRIVFTGLMNWHPNVDAMNNFCKVAYSTLKENIPDIELYIVGKNPTPEILQYDGVNNIVVTGEVEDVRQFVADSDVCVVPLRIGGGTRLKIIEYFAMKKPVISTSIGAEGILAIHEEHLIIEDDISKYPEKIIEIMNNRPLREKIVQNAHQLAQIKYSWDIYENDLNQLYLEILNAK